jgi:apolipoprotein N-acyltransferase
MLMKDERGSIYFRGAAMTDVTRDQRWVGRNSFYVEHGDWFVAACGCVAVLAAALLASGAPDAPRGRGR